MKTARILLMLLLMTVCTTRAQDQPTYKGEVGGGVGLTNYVGDFNDYIIGKYQIGANLLYRFVFSPYSALKVDAGYAQLKGSSADVKTYYPDYAEQPYTFNRSLIDVNATYEYSFWPYGTGRDYRGAVRLTPYVFFGLGATLTTGTPGSNMTANVPLGIGLKYKIADRLNLGLSWAVHLSMSDKLDGVADPYYVQSSGMFKNTDCYTSLRLTLTYSVAPKCPTCNKDDW